MLIKTIIIFLVLFPFQTFSQEGEGESTSEVSIGSSGIDLAPIEELATPTEESKPQEAAPAPSEPQPEATTPPPPQEAPPSEPPPQPAQ